MKIDLNLKQFINEMKIVACIEARYSSTRFPGKMLADIEGKPCLKE